MPVTVKDNGWSLLKARLNKTRPRVKVGIFGDAAAAKANDSKTATVGQIANAHEHGIGVPRRSWLGDTIDANQSDIIAGLRKAAAAVLKSKDPGLEAKLLAQTGQHIAGLARQRISSGISPALSSSYLERKLRKYPGATTPLIASGQMWGAIGSVVEGAPVAIKAARAAARKAARASLARRKRNRAIARRNKKIQRTTKKVRKLAAKNTRKLSRFLKRSFKRTTKRVRRALR